ncbi:SRPBCC domain-containing protein [Massilia violaceinigra]|uniref:SRPBCC domain-containing protein n=1 Tax=Massilia violaceinigra TaxID=2045208 RepID=A0ABY4A571_9BURK|nr:SRPBCC domain-containing protein [Massilia violaceinigra]UOD29527.1 SRPBCC domain-containing protein [Massilia violaceinigra]
MSDIFWPSGYLPGTTDNYVSNDIVVAGLSAAEVWPHLDNTLAWPAYYGNVSDIRFDDGSGPRLSQGARFRFATFGFAVHAEVTEYQPPAPGVPARVAWHGWVEGDAATRLDAHHAWLFEDLPGGRVRILTQETQNGAPAREMALARPNPMLNAHQAWIDGLAATALRASGSRSASLEQQVA